MKNVGGTTINLPPSFMFTLEPDGTFSASVTDNAVDPLSILIESSNDEVKVCTGLSTFLVDCISSVALIVAKDAESVVTVLAKDAVALITALVNEPVTALWANHFFVDVPI